ncbi:MAG: dCTP deaminase [Alphaproteobacteria bacterium]
MILSAKTIKREVEIAPFVERTVHPETGMSYGLSIAGYDVRVREEVNLEPGRFMLASIIERIVMPRDVLANVADKSTLRRMGITLGNTIIEPGWHGYLTVEINNHGPGLVRLPAGSPIGQIIFYRVDKPCRPYTGKYQGQGPAPVEATREEIA